MRPAGDGIWPAVYRVIDEHPDVERLIRHGVGLLAGADWADCGISVPEELRHSRMTQAALGLESRGLVRSLRQDTDGPLVLLKGLDVAAHYPAVELRQSLDVDVLVDDAVATQRALLAAGWQTKATPGFHEEPERNESLHQLCPLLRPPFSLPLEVHRRPNAPTWLPPLPTTEIIEAARPSAIDVDGVLSPCVEHHALVVLAHSWATQPFARFSELIDFALLLESSDMPTVRAVARRWRMTRLLDLGLRTIDSLLHGRQPAPWVVRSFAGHLLDLSEPSRRRSQVNRYAASAFVAPIPDAARAAIDGAGRRVRVMFR